MPLLTSRNIIFKHLLTLFIITFKMFRKMYCLIHFLFHTVISLHTNILYIYFFRVNKYIDYYTPEKRRSLKVFESNVIICFYHIFEIKILSCLTKTLLVDSAIVIGIEIEISIDQLLLLAF